MPEAKLLLISGRSLKQGTGLNAGKDSAEYQEATGVVEMNAGDMALAGLRDGDAVMVTSPFGESAARCRKANLPQGMAFIAYGPASSLLMGNETHASGMPDSKVFEVTVRSGAPGEAADAI